MERTLQSLPLPGNDALAEKLVLGLGLVLTASLSRRRWRAILLLFVGLWACTSTSAFAMDLGESKLQEASPADHLGRIGSFLLGSLQPTSAARYQQVVSDFNNELAAQGVAIDDADEAELDMLLAERVLDYFDVYQSKQGLGSASTLVAAFSKVHPRHSYKTAWKCLDAWRVRCPPDQALTVPAELAFGMVSWLVLHGRMQVAACVLLCFTGLLRASEALRLDFNHVIFGKDCVILVLGRTKRGLEQKVVLTNVGVAKWLRCFALWRAKQLRKGEVKFIGTSYSVLVRWIRKAASALGFGHLHWTSHGFRRGGATELLRAGWPMQDIMQFGRWLAVRSCREYLRRGEVSITRLRHDVTSDTWAKLQQLAAFGPLVWDTVLPLEDLNVVG